MKSKDNKQKPVSMKSAKELRADINHGSSRKYKALNELAKREKIKENA